MYELAGVLVLLNAFNLLPLAPLDGGRLLEVLLFSRHAVLAAAFRVLAVCGLAGIALLTDGVVLWVLAGLILVSVPMAYKQTAGVTAFRRAHSDIPSDPTQLSDSQLRELIDVIRRSLPTTMSHEKYAEWARVLHGWAIVPPAPVSQVVCFLGSYALGVAATVVFLWLVAQK